jgi:hypothetical protein
MAVSADKILTSVYDTIFTLLNTYAFSVTDAASSTVTLKAWSTGNYWTGAWPDFDIENKDNYPCAVLHTASSDEMPDTYAADKYVVSIKAEVMTTKGQHVALFAEKIMKEMKDHADDLRDAGLKYKSVDKVVPDFIMRDKIRIHYATITFNFEVIEEI